MGEEGISVVENASIRTLLLVAIAVVLALTACSGNAEMTNIVRESFERHPGSEEILCADLTAAVSGRSDLEEQLDGLNVDQRTEIVETVRSKGEEPDSGYPAEATSWGWAESKEFMLAAWDVCEDVGRT